LIATLHDFVRDSDLLWEKNRVVRFSHECFKSNLPAFVYPQWNGGSFRGSVHYQKLVGRSSIVAGGARQFWRLWDGLG
jgi:hypothetical protein